MAANWNDSRWRDARKFEWGGIVCEVTGAQAVDGECPHHGGDSCLVNAAVLITALYEYIHHAERPVEQAAPLVAKAIDEITLGGRLFDRAALGYLREALNLLEQSLSTSNEVTLMEHPPYWPCEEPLAPTENAAP